MLTIEPTLDNGRRISRIRLSLLCARVIFPVVLNCVHRGRGLRGGFSVGPVFDNRTPASKTVNISGRIRVLLNNIIGPSSSTLS